MTYLPEWKIYLWKKLLLNEKEFETTLTTDKLVFFTEAEKREATLRHAQHVIDTINKAKYAAIATRTPMEVSDGEYLPHDDAHYSFEPKKVLLALIELAEIEPAALKIESVTLGKAYIDHYRKKHREHLAMEHRKRIASISGGRGHEIKDNYLNDKFCGLGEKIYSKVEKGQELTLAELKSLLGPVSVLISFDFFSFKIKLDKGALEKRFDFYIDAFMDGSLMVPPKIRYFSFEKQKTDFIRSLQEMTKRYGNKNIPITFEELAKQGGWYQKDEKHYRFYETLLALEKQGNIHIHELRKHEVILSLNSLAPQTTPAVPVSVKVPSIQKEPVIESIKSITFISENKKADKVSSFYINEHIHDVHKMQSLSAEVRKLAKVASGEEVPFEKQTHDYINTNKNCVLYRNGKYKLTKIIDGHKKPLRIARGIKVEVIDDTVFKRRIAQVEKVAA